MAEIIQLSASKKQPDDILETLKSEFSQDIASVEIMMRENMGSYVDLIPEIGAHIVKAGGKRLRPLLTLAGAKLTGYAGDKHIPLAAAVEFMHTATLLHDDVVDDSDMRRGMPTARMKWGNSASVLVGDFMLGQAFRMMVAAESLKALDVLSNAAAIIAEGEVMQLANLQNIDITEDNYLRVVEAKTAALFAAAIEVGAIVSGSPKNIVDALQSYGRNLGVAFQLIDDALDYGNQNNSLGKNYGDDFREGKITLPVIMAFRRGDEVERVFWSRVIKSPSDSKADLDQAIQYLQKTRAIDETLDRAAHYGHRAKDALALFPDSDLKQQLLELVDFCIGREH
jgi:octaprenyl-diphosphate synthase